MRRAFVLFLAWFVLTGASPAEKKETPAYDVTGLEWLEMSVGARTDHILAAMMRLNQNGVPLTRPPDEYYRAVHDAVRRDPSLYEVSVTTIVARHAYKREPEARPALDASRAKER